MTHVLLLRRMVATLMPVRRRSGELPHPHDHQSNWLNHFRRRLGGHPSHRSDSHEIDELDFPPPQWKRIDYHAKMIVIGMTYDHIKAPI